MLKSYPAYRRYAKANKRRSMLWSVSIDLAGAEAPGDDGQERQGVSVLAKFSFDEYQRNA